MTIPPRRIRQKHLQRAPFQGSGLSRPVMSITRSEGMDRIDQRITELVLRGEPNKAVAKEVGVPEGTVKWRLHRLYDAVGARNRTEFALKVKEVGIDRLRILVAQRLEENEGG